MIHHEINKENNFICGYYTDRMDIIDGLVGRHYVGDHRQGMSFKDGKPQVVPTTKKSTDVTVEWDWPEWRNYVDHIHQPAIDQYLGQYKHAGWTTRWRCTESCNIQHYKPTEGYYEYHMERSSPQTAMRHLVFMTFLNTVKDGGETEFFYQNTKIKAEKGLTLIWPSDWTHLHRGVTSPTEDKYIITGWLSYVE